jgi:hypothetical protein
MKRIRLLVLAGAVAVALPFGLATAKATGTTGGTTTNSVSINYAAQYDLNGNIIHVGLSVRCKPGIVPLEPGQVDVTVEQGPPETAYPVAAGGGLNNVVCDGRSHSVGVSITGIGFDAGRAKATATLIPPAGGGNSVTTTRTINIIVMNRSSS